jgi:hypothetical protein
MRDEVINRLIEMQLDDRHYGEWLRRFQFPDDLHEGVKAGLARMTDAMLLSAYTRAIRGYSIVICSVAPDGQYADCLIGGMVGGMTEDGQCHT